MSTEETKDGVVMTDATPLRGRRKGRRHDQFVLPSGEMVTIYYVNPETLPTGYYYAGMPKAFYAQVAGQEFRSDAPTKIQPAVIEYLKETKPAVFKEVIVIGSHINIPASETIKVLNVNFIRTKYGVRGDGMPMLRGNSDFDVIFHPSPHTKIVPFTEKRWTNIKSAERTVNQIHERLETLNKMDQEEAAAFLESQPVIDIIELE